MSSAQLNGQQATLQENSSDITWTEDLFIVSKLKGLKYPYNTVAKAQDARRALDALDD